jgi:hypothetical protein
VHHYIITGKFPQVLSLLFLVSSGAFLGAAPPPLPQSPIAKKTAVLFSDNFESNKPSSLWHPVVPTFTFESGTLKGSQTRDKNVPAADGKPGVLAHAAVYGLNLPTSNSVVECKIKFAGAAMLDVEFDDRNFTGSHYGHICRAQVRLHGITIIDEKEGSMRNDIYEMSKDASKKTERAKLMAGRQATFPVELEENRWYNLTVETANDAMRVSLDGKPAGYLKSSGIGHPTKSKIELGVGGKDGYFDNIKVWSAEPATPDL